MLQGPSLKGDDFLMVQPMSQRKGTYSRIVWLEISGLPFKWCSLESISSTAKAFGEILYVSKVSYELHQASSLKAFMIFQAIRSNHPRHI